MENDAAAASPPPRTDNVIGLDRLSAVASAGRFKRPPPVHLWNPPFCGDIDMRIARDGTWFYQGTPIGRAGLVKLFASILRKDPERFVLVTPVEKVGIAVDDAPFLAVEMMLEEGGRLLRFRTNVDDWVSVGPEHALRFEPGAADGLKPYVRVRDDLWALVTRPLFYDLVAAGGVRDVEGTPMFGVTSAGVFFPMAPADAIGALA
jgi:hypothetical protein